MVNADYYYPDWGWPFIFQQSRVEKLLSLARDWTHNLRSLFSVRCLWPLSHNDPILFEYMLLISIIFCQRCLIFYYNLRCKIVRMVVAWTLTFIPSFTSLSAAWAAKMTSSAQLWKKLWQTCIGNSLTVHLFFGKVPFNDYWVRLHI